MLQTGASRIVLAILMLGGLACPARAAGDDSPGWAFQPLRRVEPPLVPDSALARVRNDVDKFIVNRLETEGLKPAPEAGRGVLIGRLTQDLTGLPPTPNEVEAFEADAAPQAYERLVDRLLASPRYGERMARHWLDLVRYSDGDGYRADDYRPDAWRYRDYVIRSLNADKPYDRFVQEQLAGDEMFPGNPDAIVATGYLRNGIYEWNARDVRGQWDVILNDLTDTTGDVFLGLGIQCARCHDHKFDPILQRDYFRLQAYFAAIQPGDRVVATPSETEVHAEQTAEWEARTVVLREELAFLEKPYLDRAESNAVARFPEDIQAMIRTPPGDRTPYEAQLAALAWRQVVHDQARMDPTFTAGDKERIATLRSQLAAPESGRPAALPIAMAVTDVGPVAPPMLVPGKPSLGEIEPGPPSVLDPAPARIIPVPGGTGRRSTLARWLTTPGNPLTARVIVNRAWQQHFGRGLAANASDFGVLGEKPSHPELLEWLAGWFVREGGWSLKSLHRLLVTSTVYRRSSVHPEPEAGRRKDPENRLLSRWHPRRLEAEQIRDAMLAVSGELEWGEGGPGVTPDVPRRTIHTRFMRNKRDPLADAFDAPQWIASACGRDTTTTPVQSLLLINSPAMRLRGRAFAKRLERTAPDDPVAQVRLAYRLAFGRDPCGPETDAAIRFLSTQAALAGPARPDPGGTGTGSDTMDRGAGAVTPGRAALADFCQALFNGSEFLYVE